MPKATEILLSTPTGYALIRQAPHRDVKVTFQKVAASFVSDY
jgi:hypothetical protein